MFVYVPDNVRIEKPIQACLADRGAPARSSGRTLLVVVGENAECKHPRVLPRSRLRGPGSHAGAFELYAARPGAPGPLPGLGLGRGPRSVALRRVEVQRDAHVKWVPIHLGGHLTKQTLDIITAEPGSDMRHTGMYFTERDEHLDLFTTDKHEAGHHRRHRLEGRAHGRVEGLVRGTDPHRAEGARGGHLPPDAPDAALAEGKGDAIPSLIVEGGQREGVARRHVGELDPEQIFYMMTRGIRAPRRCGCWSRATSRRS